MVLFLLLIQYGLITHRQLPPKNHKGVAGAGEERDKPLHRRSLDLPVSRRILFIAFEEGEN